MRTPDWDDVREFLKYDRWEHDAERSTDHDYFEKMLPNGEILITKVSRSGKKTMSPGRFGAILSDQLKVTAGQFWDVIRLKEPAQRPSLEPEPTPASIPLWLAQQLERVGVASATIETLDEASARDLLDEIRSRPTE